MASAQRIAGRGVVLDSGLFLIVEVYLKAKELLFEYIYIFFFYILEADKILQMNIYTEIQIYLDMKVIHF